MDYRPGAARTFVAKSGLLHSNSLLLGWSLVSVALVDLVVSCGGEEKTSVWAGCVLDFNGIWGGGGHMRDIMLTNVCGGGTYMCLQFSV
jgi:hypothetical protein